MDRLVFLHDYYDSVRRALEETLRYDYKPEQSLDFFSECQSRLANIHGNLSRVRGDDQASIAQHINELNRLSNWICLIERSHLGEFSWPFSEVLKGMADEILAETDLFGDTHKPIINIVSEGDGYRITYETTTMAPSSRRRFAFVVFPRPLKHHVLLHTLFGHELCHTAFHATVSGAVLKRALDVLTSHGPLRNVAELNDWLNLPSAPAEVRGSLAAYRARSGHDYVLTDADLASWRIEFLCDLFGLILFGPGFIPAHSSVISYSQRGSHVITKSHPIFEARSKLLIQAMRILGWDQPTLSPRSGDLHLAERRFLDEVCRDSASTTWEDFFEAADVSSAIRTVQAYLQTKAHLAYSPAPVKVTEALVGRLAARCPPIFEEFDEQNEPQFDRTHIGQTLYAGWLFWYGQDILGCDKLTFTQVNQLCDHALLQQAAINIARY